MLDLPRGALCVAALLSVAALATPTSGQCSPPTCFTPVLTDVDYNGPSIGTGTLTCPAPCPPGGAPITCVRRHDGQKFNLFVPQGSPPPGGWPVLAFMSISGFTASSRGTEITALNGLLHEALTHPTDPMAVAWASCTVSRGGASGNSVDDPVYDPSSGLYGPAYRGNGVFVPPGVLPANYISNRPPYDDLTRPMPEKDVVMFIQHLRENAVTYGIDPDRVVAHGRSAGAITWMWAAFGPDRGDVWGSGASGQELQPTRPDAAVLDIGATYFKHFDPPTASHFPELLDACTPPSTLHPFDVPADSIFDTDPDWLDGASSLVYGRDTGVDPLLPLRNLIGPFQLKYSVPGGAPTPHVFDIFDGVDVAPMDGINDAYTPHLEGIPPNGDVHASWSGHAWKTYFCSTTLVTDADSSYTAAGDPWPDGNGTPPLSDDTDGRTPAEVMDWIVTQIDDDPFEDLGDALAGAGGAPQLVVSGNTDAGAGGTIVLDLSNGAAGVTAVVVASPYWACPQPFKGGLLHLGDPALTFLINVPLDGAGDGSASLTWPVQLEKWHPIVFQAGLPDASGPFGYTLTNAVRAVTLP